MATVKYYPEDVLVEKFQSGEFGWLDYVNHHSKQWQDEFEAFCKARNFVIGENSAEQFVNYMLSDEVTDIYEVYGFTKIKE